MIPALYPKFLTLGDGYFLTYHDFATGQTVMRLNNAGEIENSEVLAIPAVQFAYLRDSRPHLVSHHSILAENIYTNVTSLYRFDDDANLEETIVLRVEPLPAGELPAGQAFDYSNDVLSVLWGSVVPGVPLNDFRAWLTRYEESGLYNAPAWDPGPLPQQSFISQWGILRAANGQYVMAMFIRGEFDRELWFMGLEASGASNNMIYIVPVALNQSVNGLSMIELQGSLVAAITEVTDNAQPSAGMQLLAFPLDILLDTEVQDPVLVNDFALTAYPNPFNPSTTIQFSVAKAGAAKLMVYDVLGREVATLMDRRLTAGSYQYMWTAAIAASGKYFCELTIDQHTRAIPLTLTK
ncbi:MAG: T9SS type A sorting domain-containing protein [bacterium]|nr:T9SS type A sorting domain-containing protein [bacterium]